MFLVCMFLFINSSVFLSAGLIAELVNVGFPTRLIPFSLITIGNIAIDVQLYYAIWGWSDFKTVFS